MDIDYSIQNSPSEGLRVVLRFKQPYKAEYARIWNYSKTLVSVRLFLGADINVEGAHDPHWEAAQGIIQLLIAWFAANSDYTVRDINIFGRPLGFGETGSWGTAHRDDKGEWTTTGRIEAGVLTEGDAEYWETGDEDDEEYWNGEDDDD